MRVYSRPHQSIKSGSLRRLYSQFHETLICSYSYLLFCHALRQNVIAQPLGDFLGIINGTFSKACIVPDLRSLIFNCFVVGAILKKLEECRNRNINLLRYECGAFSGNFILLSGNRPSIWKNFNKSANPSLFSSFRLVNKFCSPG